MTKDEIIDAAREAGLLFNEESDNERAHELHKGRLLAFADLVATKEREACASLDVTPLSILASDFPVEVLQKYRAAIRARGGNV